ncbi:MAG: winged helix DNA-binding domain-containing protein, partial [Deltaproteobacteria bacterium]|nr:winged helix DNA-binding domain-containing protein [Deltaproteobacteria bacterium]
PTHEVAFQVLLGEDVVVNDFMRGPLLQVFERVAERFEARVDEREVQAGLFRVPVPSVDRRAFREALANALTHRDYTRLGAVHVRWERDAVTVSNPGGFVEGVTLANLLTVDPRPRNPLLADAFKRVGLVERTGRGVDLMYRGLLRYGRPAPDYTRSTDTQIIVRLSTADADLAFLEMILQAERDRGGPLPVDALIALSLLREERRVDVARVERAIQKDDASARRVVEALVEEGYAEAHGVKKGRTYTLSARVYRLLGDPGGYVRQAGFDAIQQEQMVMTYAATHGVVRRQDVMALCRLSGPQATRLLARLEASGRLVREGQGRGVSYHPERKK